MKVFITKYALSKGIISTELDKQEWENEDWDYISVKGYCNSLKKGRDIFASENKALARAAALRTAKIKSLKKSLEKISGMKFNIKPLK